MRKSKTISRKPETVFAFVVDGECEFWYLQLLRRHEKDIRIGIEPKIPQRKTILELYKKTVELAKEYTHVFWIVDFDTILKENRETQKGKKSPLTLFKEYYHIIQQKHKNVTVIINNPCLEYWYLLHYKKTTKHYNTFKELEPELKKHIPDYDKTMQFYMKKENNIYLRLKRSLPDAIKNAKSIKEFDFSNPSGVAQMHFFYEQEIEGKKLIERIPIDPKN